MITVEQKKVANVTYKYLSERVRCGEVYKKIKVYLGKKVPKNLRPAHRQLEEKELALLREYGTPQNVSDSHLEKRVYEGVEKARIHFKYYFATLSQPARERFWRTFATRFIFESNAIEGSRLSESEVERIVHGGYVPKHLNRKEVVEVENAIRAFTMIRSADFTLNQRTICGLHTIVTAGLGVGSGYKKHAIVVNNTQTTPPHQVRSEMTQLIAWWRREKKEKRNPFFLAVKFHQRFEHIHPFEDGNGRVGRLLFVWMLLRAGYGAILFLRRNRQKYFAALHAADEGRNSKLYRFCANVYIRTVKEFVD